MHFFALDDYTSKHDAQNLISLRVLFALAVKLTLCDLRHYADNALIILTVNDQCTIRNITIKR